MEAKFKYLLGGGVFLICVCSSYCLSVFLMKPQEDTSDILKQPSSTETNDPYTSVLTVTENDGGEVTDNLENSQTIAESIKIEKTEVNKNGETYSLYVTCTDVPMNIVLGYEIPALGMKNSDGFFAKIPGTSTGSYQINVTDSETGKILASKVVSGFQIAEERIIAPMNSSEFQSLLLKGDNTLFGGMHPKVAKSIALSFEGLQEGDIPPTDILKIYDKIEFGMWKSAKVLRVSYDEKGRINSAKIQPIY